MKSRFLASLGMTRKGRGLQMRKSALLLASGFLLLAPVALRATTVTGTVKDSQGNPVSGAVVRLQLENCGAGGVCTLTGGGGIVSTLPVSTTTASDGTFSIVISGNDTITPAGTFYEVRYIAATGTIYSANYNVTGTTFNLNNQTPLGAMPPAPIAAAYTTVANGGVTVQRRQVLNFVNGGCADNSANSSTDCTIAGGGGGGATLQTNGTNNSSQTTLNLQSSGATNGVTLTETNTSAGNVQLGLTGVLAVPGGGTGLASLVSHSLYVGNGTSSPNSVATGNAGQVLISNGASADPTFQDPIVSGPDATGAAPSKNPVQVGSLDNSTSCSAGPCVRSFVLANSTPAGTEYGLITRNIPGGTQAVSGTFWQATQPVSESNIDIGQGSTTSGQKGPLIQGAVTISAPSYTALQTDPLSLNTAGGLRVDGSAVTQPVSGTVTANAGTGTFNIQSNASVNVAQVNGSTVSTAATGVQKVGIVGNAGASVDAATGAAPPANAVFVGGIVGGATGGFLGGIPVCDSYDDVNISTATTTLEITGVSGRQVRICSLHLVTAAANNVAIIEGTGATCGTGTAGMAGGTTAASGYNLAANGGLALGSGVGTVMRTATTGDSVCIVTSAGTQLSGGISYVIY